MECLTDNPCSRPKASRLSERLSRIEQLLAENLIRDTSPSKLFLVLNRTFFAAIAMALYNNLPNFI